jgi:nitrogen regulatory protein PII
MKLVTHKKKRIEIMIEAPALDRITEALDRLDATGYTVIPALAGKGMAGSWQRDDAFADAGRIVCVVSITDAARVEGILVAIKDVVERYIGIVSVADVEVIRSEHF